MTHTTPWILLRTKDWSYHHRLTLLVEIVLHAQVELTHDLCTEQFATVQDVQDTVQEVHDCILIIVALLSSPQVGTLRQALYWILCSQSSSTCQGPTLSLLLSCLPGRHLSLLGEHPLDHKNLVLDVTWELCEVACDLVVTSVTQTIFTPGLDPVGSTTRPTAQVVITGVAIVVPAISWQKSRLNIWRCGRALCAR